MLILAVDTALQRCSVAILRDGETLASEIEEREKGHAERLAPMVDAAFLAAGVLPGAVDRIGVVVGPGGFTGVRVGLAFARAMGLAAAADVIGVTSVAALAANLDTDSAVASVIDARRGQVYGALHRGGDCLVPPFVAAPEEAASRLAEAALEECAVVGSGAVLLPPRAGWRLRSEITQIDPHIVARLAATAPAPAPAAMPAPLYLRPPDAKLPGAKPPAS